jgi:hypothetical protein
MINKRKFVYFVLVPLLLIGLVISLTPASLFHEAATAQVDAPVRTGGTAGTQGKQAQGMHTQSKYYDVVVIGSEIQGVLLAREAQKQGLSVLILDPRSKPGGELIQGQMMFLDEPHDAKKRSLVQGEIKTLFDGYNSGKIRKAADFKRYYNRLIKGIPVRSGITVKSVTAGASSGSKKLLKSLTYRDPQGSVVTVEAGYWVENTDFNALTGKLNAKRIPGMERISKVGHPDYMAATMMLKFKHVNWSKLHQAVLDDYPLTNVRDKYGGNTYVDWDFATGFSNITLKYKPRDPQLLLRGMNTSYQKGGEAIMNSLLIFDVNPSDPKSVQSALDKAKAEAPFILQFLRKNIPGFDRAELNGFPDYLYIRDYNRFETDYILTFSDVMNSRMFWDNVSIGGYALDLQGTRTVPKGIHLGQPDRYGIPLRSFELKGYDNVLVTGKNIGASIEAYGSARIMPNTALAAQTIGIILGRELKQGKHLHDLNQEDFKRIHQYLKKEYHIKVDG